MYFYTPRTLYVNYINGLLHKYIHVHAHVHCIFMCMCEYTHSLYVIVAHVHTLYLTVGCCQGYSGRDNGRG